MKALFTSTPGEYGLTDRPKPTPDPDEVLLKVVRAGLCHTDLIIRAGVAGHVRYPVIPGHEFSGVVETCGSGVRYLQPGDRACVHSIFNCGQCSACRKGDICACEHYDDAGAQSDGGFAEYCSVPARHLLKLPDHVTFEEGALMEPLANACAVIRLANIKMGEKVVIVGPGPIGLLGKQLVPEARTVNVRREGGKQEIQELLGGKGADVIIECAGTPSAWGMLNDLVAFRGRILIEALYEPGQTVPIDPYGMLVCRAVSVSGVCGWLTCDFVHALECVSRKMVDVAALHTHTFSLDEWETAFEYAEKRKSEAIKIEFAL